MVDETWVYKFTPTSKRNLETSSFTHYIHKEERGCMFWDREELMLCEFLSHQKTRINTDEYCETLQKLQMSRYKA
jgi:hypothetical protein